MNEEIDFRNAIHKGAFRFDVSSYLWRALYTLNEDGKPSNVITITENGKLHGYAVYFPFVRGQFKQLSIVDLCADSEETLRELLNHLKKRAEEQDVDYIYVRKAIEPFDRVFDQNGYISFVESVIMIALLNPAELLRALSQEVEGGDNLILVIEGFDPVTVRVGHGGMKVVTDARQDLTVMTDSNTFLKLVFSRTSFWKELLRGRVKVKGLLKLVTASRFFKAIKQEKWYIPFADWA